MDATRKCKVTSWACSVVLAVSFVVAFFVLDPHDALWNTLQITVYASGAANVALRLSIYWRALDEYRVTHPADVPGA